MAEIKHISVILGVCALYAVNIPIHVEIAGERDEIEIHGVGVSLNGMAFVLCNITIVSLRHFVKLTRRKLHVLCTGKSCKNLNVHTEFDKIMMLIIFHELPFVGLTDYIIIVC